MTVYQILYDQVSRTLLAQRLPGGPIWVIGSTLGL